MFYSYILGTGSYLPNKILSNADLEKMVDTHDAWIVERTGIRERHIAHADETTSQMATAAAKQAIAAADIDKNTIDLIIVATTTPDKIFPSTACLVQDQLGIHNDCAAVDVNAACAGFNYALSTVDQFIKTGNIKRALVIGSEKMSTLVDWKDRSTCILFGDGAGAVIIEARKEPGILSTHLHAAGQYKDLLYMPSPLQTAQSAYMQMEGGEVFKMAVTKLERVVQEVLLANNLQPAAIDWLIPHQANLRIIQAIAKKLNLTMERVIVTIDGHGNTSAASLPLALDTAIRDGRIQRGQTLLLESFGGGFAWGAALIRY